MAEDKPWLDQPIVRPLVPKELAESESDESLTTARSVARNVAAGAVEGATSLANIATDPFGTVIGPTIGRVLGTAYDAGAHVFGYPAMTPEQRADLYGQNPTPPEQQPIATRVVNAVDQAIPGPKVADVQANTPPEQIARKVTAAGVAGGAGGVGSAIVSGGGAVIGDIAGRSVPDWLAPGAELAGNVAGSKATSRVVSPVRTVTSPERQRLVEQLDTEGVPITAGERTGSRSLQKTEQMLGQLPGSAGRVAEQVAGQQREINHAVASRAGLNSDTLTTGVLNAHQDATGAEIGRLASSNNLQMDAPFVQQLGQVRQNLGNMKTEVAQEIGARLDQLRRMISIDPATGNPVLAGPQYQTLMSDLREAIQGADAGGTAQMGMIRFRDMLRQQMEASMNPADAARWRELNRHYANGEVIRDAMGAAGAGTAEGNISLLQLRDALNRSLGKDAYGRGYGDLNDLARAGQSVLRRPADSGTPAGTFINKLLAGASAGGAGAGAYFGSGDPLWAAAGAVAPVVGPWAIGGAMQGRIPYTNYSPGQAYLSNRLTQGVRPEVTAAIIQAANAETERNRLMPR